MICKVRLGLEVRRSNAQNNVRACKFQAGDAISVEGDIVKSSFRRKSGTSHGLAHHSWTLDVARSSFVRDLLSLSSVRSS